ncbi:unnamed protein product [Oikopleura dioica]|uniref:Uncharacterized protein n=1 Tax=Oikopleura dioica TaxID=34765 RepID=E4YW80_OIKDI|nr:unnamed protein product [Oikopleura dioica]
MLTTKVKFKSQGRRGVPSFISAGRYSVEAPKRHAPPTRKNEPVVSQHRNSNSHRESVSREFNRN